ncbi:MAG: hypothetical protein ACOCP5_03620, partial [Halanaerobiaceae bacterium]
PLLPSKLNSIIDFNILKNRTDEEYSFNNSYIYRIREGKEVLLNIGRFISEYKNQKTKYTNLETGYKQNIKNSALVIKNTARNDNSGWTPDFSQSADIYIPVDPYNLNLGADYYKGGDYTLRLGMEITDIKFTQNLKIDSINGWINNKQEGILNLRFTI